ncbi:MAG: YjbH domain-containing protein, partial [Armatimonadota bacterium]
IQYDPEEVGWERDWFNIKKQLWHETKNRPAVAVGIVNIGANPKEGRYISVGKRFGDFTIMLGWSDVLDDEYVYEGISYDINDRWDFHAEHVGRGRWSTNAAFEGRVGPRTYLSIGYMRANNSFYPDSWFADVTYRFDLNDF